MCNICHSSLNVGIDNGFPICIDCGYFLFVEHYEGDDLEYIYQKIDEWFDQNKIITIKDNNIEDLYFDD